MNPKELQKDFPILRREINGHRLVYLDSASTSQKPQVVIDALSRFYETSNANIHRGVHSLSEEATNAYEATREAVCNFVNAKESAEIIFTRGTTEAINLVASTWGEKNIGKGDEIVVSALEHHSNLVPWQQLCLRVGSTLKVIPIHEDGTLNLRRLDSIITEKTRLVAVTQMSNALGTTVPIKKIVQVAHAVGSKVLVDGAQGVPHMGFDVQDVPCDFLAFSSHKMLGPTGVGVLYVKREILETMQPYQFGGDMVKEVTDMEASWNDLPYSFEAGTPNIADTVAFKAAIDYLEEIGFEAILKHDQELVKYAREQMAQFPRIQLYGPQDVTLGGGIVSFNIPGVHPHDVGSIFNDSGIAIRTGHHCAQPLLQKLGCNATARMSFYLYNTKEDVDAAMAGIKRVYNIFKVEQSFSSLRGSEKKVNAHIEV